MQSLRQVGSGLLFGLVCIAIVLGGFSLSMAEGGIGAATAPTAVPTLTPTLPIIVVPTLPALAVTEPVLPATETPVPTATVTFTPPPPPTSCPPPAGWVPVVVQAYDTLPSLSQTYRVNADTLIQGNCLVSDQLVSGSFIYVPPLPTATRVPCGAPPGWVNYPVRPGDTLYSISLMYRVSVADLQRANCMGGTTYIQSGKLIKVPNVVPNTPVWTAGPTVTVIIIQQPTNSQTPSSTPPEPTTEVPPTTAVPPTDTPPPPTDTQVPPPTDTEVSSAVPSQ
jgi:LysM repeat protein